MRKEEFTWPEYPSESKRVKAWSARFRDLSITQAFNSVYPNEVSLQKGDGDKYWDKIPAQAKVGDILPVTIKSISKDGAILDCINQKSLVVTKANLWKYTKFREGYIPQDELQAVVMDKTKTSLTVDILTPIFHNWLDPLLKSPQIQKPVADPPRVTYVRDLKLVNGGFVGKAIVPSLSEFVGEDYEVDAFIPGSHIVLNITNDFNQFEGQTVPTFVLNYLPKNIDGVQKMSLVCSRKEYLKYLGDLNMIDIYDMYCDNGAEWSKQTSLYYDGYVTGVIHSSTKCGVFTEIPELNITGLVSVSPDELVNYKAGDCIQVAIKGFEQEKKYNGFADQYQTVPTYRIDDNGCITYSNFKPILKIK